MSCKFIALPHVSAPLPGKRKPRQRSERPVSQTGWKGALEDARKLREATVYLVCGPNKLITMAHCYDYACRLASDVRASSNPIAGLRRRRRGRR